MNILRKRGEAKRFGMLRPGTVFNDNYLKASIWDPELKKHVDIYVELTAGIASWAEDDYDSRVTPNLGAILFLENGE